MDTARKIRELRIKKGLTQDQMEAMTGIDQAHISRIERGARRRVSAEVLVRIARALGCTVEDLVALGLPVAA